MYMNSQIAIYLTPENQGVLEKPSKIFNKMKASFSGAMTPAETNRAEVMLSVLQRVNKALRTSDITNLVSLSINNTAIYQDEVGVDNDLKEGALSFVRNVGENNIKSFSCLEQIVEHSYHGILFIYSINVIKNPKEDESPVSITVSGLPTELKRKKSEDLQTFESRITQFVSSNHCSGEKIAAFNKQYLDIFNKKIDHFITEIDRHFPIGSHAHKYQMRLLDKVERNSLLDKIGDYFRDDILYMDYWLTVEEISDLDDDFDYCDLYESESCSWFDGIAGSELGENTECNSSSWTDSLIDSFSSSNSDSSCGSSCGGCGGD